MMTEEDKSYPNCEKLAKQGEEHRAIMTFLGEMGDDVCLCKRNEPTGRMLPMSSGEISNLIYRYLGVDPVELENERRAMLKAAQECSQ